MYCCLMRGHGFEAIITSGAALYLFCTCCIVCSFLGMQAALLNAKGVHCCVVFAQHVNL